MLIIPLSYLSLLQNHMCFPEWTNFGPTKNFPSIGSPPPAHTIDINLHNSYSTSRTQPWATTSYMKSPDPPHHLLMEQLRLGSLVLPIFFTNIYLKWSIFFPIPHSKLSDSRNFSGLPLHSQYLGITQKKLIE